MQLYSPTLWTTGDHFRFSNTPSGLTDIRPRGFDGASTGADDRLVPRVAFVLLTRELTHRSNALARRLSEQVASQADFFVSGYDESARVDTDTPFNTRIYNRADLDQRFSDCLHQYAPRGKTWNPIPGRIDLVRIAFCLDYPQYDLVWLCEDDVRFSGDMGEVLRACAHDSADLLAPHLMVPGKDWRYIDSLERNRVRLHAPASRRAFLPFCRYSRKMALSVLDEYRQGLSGHFEYTWPHVAATHGLPIRELNEVWEQTRPTPLYPPVHNDGMRGRQSFVYRPAKFTGVWPRNTLFHPVKPWRWVIRREWVPAIRHRAISLVRRAARSITRWISALRGQQRP